METMRKSKPTINSKHAQVGAAVSDLLHEGKKYANELYEEGLDKMSSTEREIEQYSEDLIKKVRENPLKAVLIAGGIGFLVSALLRK
ncbi:MAG: hypothetical protein Q8R24_10410 [Legionellaceae bacterium]|nr:hypothetical protein [Legionellaceae bacterium]